MADEEGWSTYQRLVLDKLETLEAGQKSLNAKVSKLETGMAVLTVKSGIWGFLAGAVPAAIAVLVHLFHRNK